MERRLALSGAHDPLVPLLRAPAPELQGTAHQLASTVRVQGTQM